MSDGTKAKGVADIVFLLDVTGSMQDCLDAVKASIGTFISALANPGANNDIAVKDWRIKICGFRDHASDGAEWFVDHPFSRDPATIQSALNSAQMIASGGGDEPESLLDALYKISNIGETSSQETEQVDRWRTRGKATRAVIFFTDATFKTPMTLPEAHGGVVSDVVVAVQGAKLILCGFVPEWDGYLELGAADKAEIDFFARVSDTPALSGLGKSGSEGSAAARAAVHALQERAKDPTQFGKIMAQLAKTISKSATVERIE
jgi:von Willebrand factor type A domain